MTRSRATADTQDNNGGSVAPFVAGKNVLLNSDFRINQRNFSSTTTSAVYTFDRWATELLAPTGSSTYTPQTFTPGAAPVAGYEGINYLRNVCTGLTGATYALIEQRVEDVRTLSGQTVTLSFWARATSGTPKVGLGYVQNFGSGGSSNVNGPLGDVTISSSWTRYSVTATLPSVSGKTIGANSFVRILIWFSASSNYTTWTSIGIQNTTIDIWGVQLEAGSVATPFTTATGNPASELAACQRYYQRLNTSASSYSMFAFGIGQQSTRVLMQIPLRVNMRTAPSSIGYGGTVILSDTVNNVALTSVALDSGLSNESYVGFAANVSSGITVNRPYILRGDNSASAFFEINAEL